MYKKILVLVIISLFASCAAQPAMAAWQPLNQTLGDLKLQRAKAIVTGGIDGAIATLEAAGDGVARSKLTDGQKAELEAQIGSNVTWLEAKKRDVEASGDVPGVLGQARQARDRWDAVYPALKKETGLMACDNFDAELARARGVETIASAKIESLKAQEKATGSLEKALDDYRGHVDDASRHAVNARSEFDGIAAPNDGHFVAGQRQLSQAENDMKSAYSDLKNIYRLLLGNGVKTT